jgi:hypothetical protein
MIKFGSLQSEDQIGFRFGMVEQCLCDSDSNSGLMVAIFRKSEWETKLWSWWNERMRGFSLRLSAREKGRGIAMVVKREARESGVLRPRRQLILILQIAISQTKSIE